MTRLSSSSMKILRNASRVAVSSFDDNFVILCPINDGDPVQFNALTDGAGLVKFYASRTAAIRAIQRVNNIPSADIPTLSHYFINNKIGVYPKTTA